MSTALKIDFVSDVSCPWCVVGLRALNQALADLGDEVKAEIHFQPFELNPKNISSRSTVRRLNNRNKIAK
jgi:predicted DsbA family dithiol-disulfide isomerase